MSLSKTLKMKTLFLACLLLLVSSLAFAGPYFIHEWRDGVLYIYDAPQIEDSDLQVCESYGTVSLACPNPSQKLYIDLDDGTITLDEDSMLNFELN